MSDADGRVNTSSASYTAGYNQGVTDADARVNTNSESYKKGKTDGIAEGIQMVKDNPGDYGIDQIKNIYQNDPTSKTDIANMGRGKYYSSPNVDDVYPFEYSIYEDHDCGCIGGHHTVTTHDYKYSGTDSRNIPLYPDKLLYNIRFMFLRVCSFYGGNSRASLVTRWTVKTVEGDVIETKSYNGASNGAEGELEEIIVDIFMSKFNTSADHLIFEFFIEASGYNDKRYYDRENNHPSHSMANANIYSISARYK